MGQQESHVSSAGRRSHPSPAADQRKGVAAAAASSPTPLPVSHSPGRNRGKMDKLFGRARSGFDARFRRDRSSSPAPQRGVKRKDESPGSSLDDTPTLPHRALTSSQISTDEQMDGPDDNKDAVLPGVASEVDAESFNGKEDSEVMSAIAGSSPIAASSISHFTPIPRFPQCESPSLKFPERMSPSFLAEGVSSSPPHRLPPSPRSLKGCGGFEEACPDEMGSSYLAPLVTSEEMGLSPIEEKSETSSMFSKSSDDAARRALRAKDVQCIARHKVPGYDYTAMREDAHKEEEGEDMAQTSPEDISPLYAKQYYNLVAPSSDASSLMSTPTEDTFTDAADRSPLDSPYLSAGDKTPEEDIRQPKANVMSISIDSGLEAAKISSSHHPSFAKQVQSLREGANLSTESSLQDAEPFAVKRNTWVEADASASLDRQRPQRLRPKKRSRYASEDSFLVSPASDSETSSLCRPPSRAVSLEEVISQPTPVPDKLNFTQLDKFEGRSVIHINYICITLCIYERCTDANVFHGDISYLSVRDHFHVLWGGGDQL